MTLNQNMKKLILLLSLSLCFTGSANANSIEGAFGYKLGQVLEEAIESDSRYSSNKKGISPQKPLHEDFKYFLYTTRVDKKVSSIRALFYSDSYYQDYCSDNEGLFFKIMKIYELKYGKFVKNSPNEKDVNYSYTDSPREIMIRCAVTSNLNTIEITYIDSILKNIRNTEYDIEKERQLKEKEKQFLEEASEYDI